MIELLNTLLSSNTETEILEFKEAKKQFDTNKLGKYFSGSLDISTVAIKVA